VQVLKGLPLTFFCFPRLWVSSAAADPANPAEHLRNVFYRMGLSDKVHPWCTATREFSGGLVLLSCLGLRLMWFFPETAILCGHAPASWVWRASGVPQEIVALSGAHTLGRARPERSGFGKESTKYTVRSTRSVTPARRLAVCCESCSAVTSRQLHVGQEWVCVSVPILSVCHNFGIAEGWPRPAWRLLLDS